MILGSQEFQVFSVKALSYHRNQINKKYMSYNIVLVQMLSYEFTRHWINKHGED